VLNSLRFNGKYAKDSKLARKILQVRCMACNHVKEMKRREVDKMRKMKSEAKDALRKSKNKAKDKKYLKLLPTGIDKRALELFKQYGPNEDKRMKIITVDYRMINN